MANTATDASRPRRSTVEKRHQALARLLVAALILASVVVYVAMNHLDFEGGTTEPPIPDLIEREDLPSAQPEWTLEALPSDELTIHNGMLVRYDRLDWPTLYVYSLATGKKTMSVDTGNAEFWLSGNRVITMDPGASELEVRDIRTGEKLHTTKYTTRGHVGVASGALVIHEHVDEATSRLRTVDVVTGEEKWAKDLDGPIADYHMDIPDSRRMTDLFLDYGASYASLRDSASPVVLLSSKAAKKRESISWSEATALDASTGEVLWTDPIDYTEFNDPRDEGFQLTEDGDIHVAIVDRDKKQQSRGAVSYIIDSATGKVKRYPGRYEHVPAHPERRLCGRTLLTTDGEQPAIVDVVTGKSVRRPDARGNAVHNSGSLVFSPVRHGYVAIDATTGEYLWAREGKLTGAPVVAGGEVVSDGFARSEGGGGPIQVFDHDTGEGKWQLDRGELLGYDSDHFVFTEPGKQDAKVMAVFVVSRG